MLSLSTVPSDMRLYDVLATLKRGNMGHMLLVADAANSSNIQGLVTLEDVLEALIGSEIYDEVISVLLCFPRLNEIAG